MHELLAALVGASALTALARLRKRGRERAPSPAPPPPPHAEAAAPSTPALHLGPEVAAKRAALVAAGADALHLILDWDRTMTTYHGPRGGRGATCHGVVEARRGEELRAKAEVLNTIFYPIEVDPHRSRESKIPFMLVWYRLINDLIVDSRMTRSDLEEDVAAANLQLRSGMTALLAWAARHDVPVTIFSAGIGDVIEEVLQQHCGALHAKVRVVSNMIEWSAEGVISSFKEPVLHMFNKNMKDMVGPRPFFDELRARPCALLLGDSPGDVTMADGLGCATVLRVGFLNTNVEVLLAQYAALFDAVVTHDGDARWVLQLLDDISSGSGGA